MAMEMTKEGLLDFGHGVAHPWPGSGAHVGRLVSADGPDGARVALSADPGETVAARSTVPLAGSDCGKSVVLLFENGDRRLPIIMGVIVDTPLAGRGSTPAPPRIVEVREIDAGRELVLRCGKSSIVLRADGDVTIRGARILSRASETNKVKGATVQLN